MKAQERLIVALDTPGPEEARSLVGRLRGRVGMFKVGSELFTAAGPALVQELVGEGEKVFLDLKFHDIPNTVASAVSVASHLGVSFLDVHALAGPEAIRAAAEARGGVRLLAITVLTSHDEAGLARLGLEGGVDSVVERLARLAQEAGAQGVVASAREAPKIRRACGTDFLVVTPGIRPRGSALGDQSRATTPSEALQAGADYLVVGRPITRASDPVAAAEGILEEMAKA
jgi:orotidine-5'-phosphate decarboxylase